jgi:hypothetical protein
LDTAGEARLHIHPKKEFAMRRIVALTPLPLALVAALYLAGCNRNGGDAVKPDGDKAEEHDHDHAHGPHGGALVELGTDEKYHAEWATEESGKVTVWILDGEAKAEVPIGAETITIATKDPKGERSFELSAVNRTTEATPTAFQFEIEDKELLGVLETLGAEVTATLKADINGDAREGKIEKHDHSH